MGRQVDLDSPLSAEDKAFLNGRGRGYLVEVNERRFGADGKREPEAHEQAGGSTQSPFYDNDEREKAVYDVGGAPLPGTVLDYNTGRIADRDNGVLLEYTGPGHTPGAYDMRHEAEGFSSRPDEGDEEIDEDIVEKVLAYKNVTELRNALKKEKVEFAGDDKRDDLENKLAIHLQDKRDAEKHAAAQG